MCYNFIYDFTTNFLMGGSVNPFLFRKRSCSMACDSTISNQASREIKSNYLHLICSSFPWLWLLFLNPSCFLWASEIPSTKAEYLTSSHIVVCRIYGTLACSKLRFFTKGFFNRVNFNVLNDPTAIFIILIFKIYQGIRLFSSSMKNANKLLDVEILTLPFC